MQNKSSSRISFLKSILLFKDAFPLTNQIYLRFLKDNVGLIAGFALGCEILEQFFNYSDKMTMGNTTTNMIAKIGLALTTLLMTVFYAILIPMRIEEYDKQLPRRDFWAYVKDTAIPYTLENLRAFAKCLLWLVGGVVAGTILAFILVAFNFLDRGTLESIFTNQQNVDFAAAGALFTEFLISVFAIMLVTFGPATLYYLRYTFVSYIVLVDPEYKTGKVDALQKSLDLARGITWIIIVLFAFMTLFEVVRAKLGQNNGFMEAPLSAIAILIVFEVIGLYFNILLFRVYELRVASANSATDSLVAP